MGKLVLLGILGFAVWWMWRNWRRRDDGGGQPPAERPPQRMVACAYCGVNQPADECVESGGRHYCGEAHRRAAEAAERERER